MNPWLLLAVSIFATLVYGTLRNLYSKRFTDMRRTFYLFNTLSGIFSVVTLLFLSAGEISLPSPFTAWLGFLFGTLTVGATILNLFALQIGPLSYTTVIISSSMIIPTLSGALLWNEPVKPAQIAGILLVAVSFAVSVDRKASGRGASVKWLIMSTGAFLCSGMIGVLQKVHQSSPYKYELNLFLLESFLLSTLFFAVVSIVRKKNFPKPLTALPRREKTWIWSLATACGICIALANSINLYLSGVMESMIFFPMINVGNIILSTLAGIVIFREKLSVKQWIGLVLGTLSLLFLTLF